MNGIRKKQCCFLFFVGIFISSASPFLGVTEEIQIENIAYAPKTADHFIVSWEGVNATTEKREIIFRAQLLFFETGSPKGDLPAMILRKDMTAILRPGERRALEAVLRNEGTSLKGSLRLEPTVRVKQNREWYY